MFYLKVHRKLCKLSPKLGFSKQNLTSFFSFKIIKLGFQVTAKVFIIFYEPEGLLDEGKGMPLKAEVAACIPEADTPGTKELIS